MYGVAAELAHLPRIGELRQQIMEKYAQSDDSEVDMKDYEFILGSVYIIGFNLKLLFSPSFNG
jgi:hypothetical protein